MARKGNNIYKRKDGRWEAKYKIGDKYKYVYGRTKKEVQDKLKNLKSKKTCNIQLKEAAKKWLEHVRPSIRPNSYNKYFWTVDKLIIPYLGEKMTSQINDTVLQRYEYELKERKLTNKTISETIRIIKKIIEFNNNVEDKLPIEIHDKPINVLSEKQMQNLFNYFKSNCTEVGIFLLLNTGIRIGELCALTWADVDFKNEELIVNKTLQRTKTDQIGELRKSRDIVMEIAERRIPIANSLVEILRKYKQSKACYITTGKPKQHMSPRTLQNILKRHVAQLSIEVNFLDLRENFAIHAIKNGMDLRVLSQIMGINLNSIEKYCKVVDIPKHKGHEEMEKIFSVFNT